MRSRLLHLPARTVRLLLTLVVLVVCVFFALTRTEIGRDGVRQVLEAQFADRFEGALSIGRLTGNLVHELYAKDVVLLDGTGAPIVRVDSIVVTPRWSDLFSRRVSFGAIELYNPEATLRWNDSTGWNLLTALRRSEQRTPGPQGWSFTSADITVRGGSVVTSRSEAPPSLIGRGLVFDYTSSSLDSLDADLTLEWQPGSVLFDVKNLKAYSPDVRLPLHVYRGQVLVEDGALWVNEMAADLGGSAAELSAHLAPLNPTGDRPFGSEALSVNLSDGRFVFRELRRLIPVLPRTGILTGRVRARGELGGLVLEEVALTGPRSRLVAEGTVLGLPELADVQLDVRRLRLDVRDVKPLVPESAWPRVDSLRYVEGSAYLAGVYHPSGADTSHARLEATLSSAAGTVDGWAELRLDSGTSWTAQASLTTSDLDLSRLRPAQLPPSRLNGAWSVQVARQADRLQSGVTVDLSASSLADQAILGAQFTVDQRNRQVDVRGTASLQAGLVTTRFTLDATPGRGGSRGTLSFANLDLATLTQGNAVPPTSLTGRLTWAHDGLEPGTVDGGVALAMDSSTIGVAEALQGVPPFEAQVAVRQPPSGPSRVQLTSDVADVALEADASLPVLAGLGRYWIEQLRAAAAREADKPYTDRQALTSLVSDEDPVLAPPPAALLGAETTVEIEAAVRDGALLARLLPALPPLATDLVLRGEGLLSTSAMALTAALRADTLSLGTVAARDLEGTLTLTSTGPTGPADLSETTTLRIDLDAVAARQRDIDLVRPTLGLTYADRHATLTAEAQRSDRSSHLVLGARLDLLPDRNRLTVTDFALEAADYAWIHPAGGAIDIYGDAVHFEQFAVTSASAAGRVRQRIEIDGTASASRSDSLSVGVENIALRQLSAFLGLPFGVGGQANGALTLVSVYERPELTGGLRVAQLAMDDRILGDFEATSQFLPGTDDAALRVALTPVDTSAVSLRPVTTEGTALRYVPNALTINGTFRLPTPGADAGFADPGALDLSVAVEQLDAFFFEYIFRNLLRDVVGTFDGGGTIQGSFTDPVFDGRFALADASFYVPRFNLRYGVNGAVDVTRQGFLLDGVRITDPRSGSAQVGGGILFNDYRFFSFDLRGELDELIIMNQQQPLDLPFYGTIATSGSATLTGPVYDALLRSSDATTAPFSEVYIPIEESSETLDDSFIVFADSTGQLPDLQAFSRRSSILARRPTGERAFVDGLDMDLNLFAPPGSTIHLVFDPLLGDAINAVGTGRIQLQRNEGEFATYGTLEIESGDYLFTAGEVFARRFDIEDGTLTFDGNPLDARMDIRAAYRTRASLAGLENAVSASDAQIPLIVWLYISGRVSTPQVNLELAVDRDDRTLFGEYQALEALLNRPERSTEYATSVLLTNSFLLTTSITSARDPGNQLAFNSLSQLVASQLNRYLNEALPNVDLNLGVQPGSARAQDVAVSFGVALRLLDERLIIRGQGVYDEETVGSREFIVEVRLSPSVSVEVFYRRQGDVLNESTETNTTGAGISYQTRFVSWRDLVRRLFGGGSSQEADAPAEPTDEAVVRNQDK